MNVGEGRNSEGNAERDSGPQGSGPKDFASRDNATQAPGVRNGDEKDQDNAQTVPAALATRDAEIAIFAAGCFWGTEEYFRRLPGVISTEVGYCGGAVEFPSYEDVCTGATGHAESLRIEFDPAKIGYRELLRHFFRMHDPTQRNRQGNDIGTQYRSAVFYVEDRQREAAQSLIAEMTAGGLYARPLTTQVVPATTFYSAEEYHQDYLRKHPGGYCHVNLALAAKPLD